MPESTQDGNERAEGIKSDTRGPLSSSLTDSKAKISHREMAVFAP